MSERIESVLDQAIKLHQSRRFAEAEALYRRILESDPQNFDALHLLGLLAHNVGRNQEAIELMSRAESIDPAVPELHANLAMALRALGRLQEAEQHCQAALRLNPRQPDALSLL